MRYLVLSDIHGNLPALETLIKRENVDGYLNLGDVVNYAPWSNECVELLSKLDNCHNILGNHEEYFIKRKCTAKHPLVSDFFNACFPDFQHDEIISNYKSATQMNGFLCAHTIENEYVFIDSQVDINCNMLIGHSHQQYERKVKDHLLVNPGSVGQNRRFINVANYAIWDHVKNKFELKNLTFDVEIVINEMKTKKFPMNCISYYQNKERYHA